jgi:hypothetical protein
MTRDPLTQRLAGHLIRRACRRLPDDIRDERCREWAAELPAILHDPGIRFAPRRSARALRYAAGTIRSTRRQPRATGDTRQRQHAPRTPAVISIGSNDLSSRMVVGMGIYLLVVVLTITVLALINPPGWWPIIPVFVAGAGFVAFCLADLARASDVRYLPKWGWALVCFTSIPLGGIIYLSIGKVGRPRRAPPESPAPAAPR